jgi:nicotinamidase-related amidase
MQDRTVAVAAEPYPFDLRPGRCALVIIDMQRDFLEPGGFGEMLGNDVGQLRRTIEPNRRLLAAWRSAGLLAIHTREGHRPDLSDLPPAKKIRGRGSKTIGDAGPMGRILVRGEPGHDIIPELQPISGEPVIDNPGKGAFYATDLHSILQHRSITQLVVTGVTTEVCVNTTVREQRPRLRLPRTRGLRRLLLPRIPGHGPEHDQGPRRHLRLGRSIERSHRGDRRRRSLSQKRRSSGNDDSDDSERL